MDFTTIFGFLLGFGLIYFGVAEGGGIKVFLNLHGLSIVVGGTLAMTIVNSSAASLWSTAQACVRLFFPRSQTSAPKAIAALRQLADQAKANGIMALQGAGNRLSSEFLKRAVHVATTSGDAEFTRSVLEEDIMQMRMRHHATQSVLRTAGVLSPMLGLLGTLIGIVHVLQQISDPSKVGLAMGPRCRPVLRNFYRILFGGAGLPENCVSAAMMKACSIS